MPIVDAYYERKFRRAMEDTWGHLRAKPGERFKVSFVFARDLEGYDALLAFDAPEALNDSPWLHQDTHDRIEAELDRLSERRPGRELCGTLWRFDGEYVVYKNRKRKFVGRVRRVRITKPVKRWL